MVNVPALKGIHYAIEAGRLAAESAFDAIRPGRTPATPGALESYDRAVRDSFIWRDLELVRNMRPAFGRGLLAWCDDRGDGDGDPREDAARAPCARIRTQPST